MAAPATGALLHLVDRAERGALSPAEARRLRAGITALAAQRRVLLRLHQMATAWKRSLPAAVDRDAVADAVLVTLEPALPAPATKETP